MTKKGQKKNRILFVSGSSVGYGADYSMIQIINKLKKHDIESIVIIPKKGRSSELFEENNIEYIIIPFQNWIHYDLTIIGKYIKPILKFFINIILSMYTYIKIKNIYKIIGVYSNSFTNYFSIILSKIFKVKHIQHIREFGDYDFNWKFDFGRKKTIEFATKNSARLICISNAVRENYINFSNEKKMITIYNGLPITQVVKHNFNSEVINIVMVGRLSAEKRQIILLKAIRILLDRRIFNIHIDFYGDGEDLEALKKYCQDNEISNYVEFMGYSKKIDFSKYHIGVMCSISEGFGRVLVEYMMNSLAVISSNGGAAPEIINNQKTGILFEVDNEVKLADKIEELMKNRKRMQILGENARKSAINSFAEDICLDKILEECVNIFEIKYK